MQGSGFRVQGAGSRVQGSGFRVQGLGFRVQGSGCRMQLLREVLCLGFLAPGVLHLVWHLGVEFRVGRKGARAHARPPRAGACTVPRGAPAVTLTRNVVHTTCFLFGHVHCTGCLNSKFKQLLLEVLCLCILAPGILHLVFGFGFEFWVVDFGFGVWCLGVGFWGGGWGSWFGV